MAKANGAVAEALPITQQATSVPATAEKPQNLRDWVNSDTFRSAVAMALPKHLTPERFVRVALTAFMRTPKLMECSQSSVFKCLLDLSALGLEPDGRRAHLIPFKNNYKDATGNWKSQMECQLIIDYKGLAELAYRSGAVSKIHADVVCENDIFKYNKGVVEVHEIDFKKDRGNAYAYWAMVGFKDGSERYQVMSLGEVEAIRARSKAKDNGPWKTDYDEMGKKTAFRRLSKWIPLSPEEHDAIEKDYDSFHELPRGERAELDMTAIAQLTADDLTPSDDENRGHDAANAQAVAE